jgi:hypothetical protein
MHEVALPLRLTSALVLGWAPAAWGGDGGGGTAAGTGSAKADTQTTESTATDKADVRYAP